MTSKPRKKKNNEPTVLRLVGELTIFRAAELKKLLLSQPPASVIDLSGVSEIDTAGVQLLMMAKRSALDEQRTLQLTAHSAAVTEVFELLNLAADLGDPLVIGARSDDAGGARRTALA